MTLTELVPTLGVCQQLKAAGFPQDTALAYYFRGCGAYAFDDNGVTLPEYQHLLGEPTVCVQVEMEGHKAVCSAPVFDEIVNQLPKKMRFDFSLRIYLEPGGCYVGWQDWDGTGVLEKGGRRWAVPYCRHCPSLSMVEEGGGGTNYDYGNWGKDCLKKSAHELLVMAQDLLCTGVKGHYRSSVLLPELESALRKAVIREASVGVMTLGMLQHRRRMAAPIKDLPDGAYDLIPKETP